MQSTSSPPLSPPPSRLARLDFLIAALAAICIANFFNYMDRMLVSALEKQLVRDFQLERWEFGLLWSLFTIGYMVCAIPIGYLADHYHRTRLFALCVVIWSAATVATGLASWKIVLYLSRLFIGVGEAGCLVVGPALISDYFSRAARGRALSAFYLGQPLGGTAGYVLVYLVFRMDYSWHWAFYVAGIPGFLIALWILLLPDPPRGAQEGLDSHAAGSWKQYRQLLTNRSLLLIILAQTFSVIILIPLLHFGKEFLLGKVASGDIRQVSIQAQAASIVASLAAQDLQSTLPQVLALKQMQDELAAWEKKLEQTATLAMLAVMVAGALGMVISGLLGDRLARQYKGAYALVAGGGFLLGWPFLLLGFRAATFEVFLPALLAGCFCMFLCMPAVNTQIANVVHPTQRSAAWALAVFVLHLLGDTLAPPVFGKCIDWFGRQAAFESFSIALLGASFCCFAAAWTAAGDIARHVDGEAKAH